MAGAVADAQQDRFVLIARFGQRFRSPWIPVHRIIRMLQQVRTGLLGEAIAHRITLLAVLQMDAAMGQMGYRAETEGP